MLVAVAMAMAGSAMASVGGTGMKGGRHDFATRSNFLGAQAVTPGTANEVGLCSFCHTPHSAATQKLLWNRTNTNASYSWGAIKTEAGTDYSTMAGTGTPYAGPTVKCLACHDGSVSVGDVSMYKGKARAGTGSANSFVVGQQPTNYDGKSFTAADARSQFIIGASGSLTGTHPVGMPYPTGTGAAYNGKTIGTQVVLGEFQPFSVAHQVTPTSSGGGKTITYQGTEATSTGSGSADSLVKLYKWDSGNVVAATSADSSSNAIGIECSSCHDPHNKQTVDDWMLRGKAQGSLQINDGTAGGGYICLQCHIK